MYVDINQVELLKFNNCLDCVECCKTKLMAPLVLDDFKKVYKYFPILIAKLDTFKPVMLLSNTTSCPYLKDNLCSIYKNRPPACKIYPFSPWYNKILLDISCKGVGIKGEYLPLNNKEFKSSKFYEERFENINYKLKKTNNWTNNISFNFYAKIKNIKLYKIYKSTDFYSNLAIKSLINLKYYKELKAFMQIK